jgi:peptidyl-prolyl cis-trans isomerase B (cyclophilin B)
MTQPPYAEYPAADQHGYGPGYPAPPQPPARPTNSLAVAALICGVVFAPLGIIFGHMSLSQIKRSGEEGRGMAIAGLVIGYLIVVGTVILVVLSILFTWALFRSLDDALNNAGGNSPGSPGIIAEPGSQLPDFVPPQNLGGNCQYPATTEPAAKPARPPRTGRVPTVPAEVDASLSTNVGNIGLQLDNAKAPCTVNSFVSLAQQGFFDNTTCHRLATSPELGVLQCGDPAGTGAGGPGYRFPNEYPTSQYRLSDPGLQTPVIYPRGTLAMANAGQGTNGSQFFLVYRDSSLPPTYTVFGTIDETGLAPLDKVAAAGVAGGGDDGEPATEVKISSVRLN